MAYLRLIFHIKYGRISHFINSGVVFFDLQMPIVYNAGPCRRTLQSC